MLWFARLLCFSTAAPLLAQLNAASLLHLGVSASSCATFFSVPSAAYEHCRNVFARKEIVCTSVV
jgi:hypothetical protein